jgi:hypothetical protein
MDMRMELTAQKTNPSAIVTKPTTGSLTNPLNVPLIDAI